MLLSMINTLLSWDSLSTVHSLKSNTHKLKYTIINTHLINLHNEYKYEIKTINFKYPTSTT
jgi:hypothetical protein